jgi:hypothetical protein
MSISSTTCRNSYVGNGSVSVYDYTFKLFQPGDLLVLVQDTDENLYGPLVLNTDYSITGVGFRNGGSISLINADQAWLNGSGDLNTGWQILLIRWPSLVQLTDIKNQGAYFPELHENEFDYLVMQIQELNDQIQRAAIFPWFITSGVFNPVFPAVPPTPGQAVIANPSGNGFIWGPVIGTTSATLIYDAIVGSETGCNYTTLAAALAVAQPNWRILVKDSLTMNSGSGFTITVGGILIEFAPNVTYSQGGLTGPAFTIQASGVRIKGGRFSGFTTAFQINNSYNFNFITECRFAACTTQISDLNTAPNNVYSDNITES